MSMFCPKCGTILTPKKQGNEGKARMACGKCGHVSRESDGRITEKLSKKRKAEDKVQVVEEKENFLPKTDADCAQCGNKEAYYWLVQTRAGDEPETKFLKCTKCGHTWRDYS
ncbi:transcription factor S [Candidatus Woesearchaeota archaeon]|nr:transcription factor S [Candidatus Woesearchaeota archaeon]